MDKPLTSRAKRFTLINRSHPVISGQWLDKAGRPVTGAPETWVKLRYRMGNGQQATLDRTDLDSLRGAAIEARWLNDAPENMGETPAQKDIL